MKIKVFFFSSIGPYSDVSDRLYQDVLHRMETSLNQFVTRHKIIDIKTSTVQKTLVVFVMYDDDIDKLIDKYKGEFGNIMSSDEQEDEKKDEN